MSKYALANAMLDEIPEDLRALFGAKFGNFAPLTDPTTTEDATIAMGKMCVEIQKQAPCTPFRIAAC